MVIRVVLLNLIPVSIIYFITTVGATEYQSFLPQKKQVKEMLTDRFITYHLLAKIPPANGKATVEKIAVNAVMAGCVPTHLPVLIAAVQAIVNPKCG